ncbi:hypothetical protein DPMN_128361 [Dreissena polymorpha]|uniref:Uncharacterized protein n=1 Tax=Dreissena polymorpha TaxID=45954 RepID=A0A9D4H2V1_DREPO|nr:hypothetical protein DPMN_128361 [Dreissena polymorpha]
MAVLNIVACAWATLVIVAIVGSENCTNLSPIYHSGDPRSCIMGQSGPRYRFEVLPGSGWDNLRNKTTGMIVKLNFSQCRTTEDGRFLLPDGVYTVPLKRSHVETTANLFEHWSNYSRRGICNTPRSWSRIRRLATRSGSDSTRSPPAYF